MNDDYRKGRNCCDMNYKEVNTSSFKELKKRNH